MKRLVQRCATVRHTCQQGAELDPRECLLQVGCRKFGLCKWVQDVQQMPFCVLPFAGCLVFVVARSTCTRVL